MVGVGGRSKACDNCRRRRVKCDEQKPQCVRCLRAHLECGGYPGMTIIQFDGRQRRTISPSSNSRAPSEGNGSTNSGVSPPVLLQRTPSPAGAVQLYDVRPPLDVNEVVMKYTRAMLLGGSNAAYIVPSPPSHVDRALMTKAFLALSTTFFGLEHKEASLVRQGFQLYGNALENLHRALEDPSRRASFDVLESVSVLALFEFLMSDRENGWISHCIGLERLFAVRGPESFTSLSELLILENSRSSMILGAIIMKRRTVLSNPEWKTIPWTKHPVRKTFMQRMFDIFADCPGLYADKLEITSDQSLSVSDRTVKLNELLSRVYDLLNQLESWKEQWELETPRYCHEIPASSSTQNLGMQAPAWNTILEYKSPYEANSIMMYAGTLILLLMFARGIIDEVEFSATCANHPESLNFPERLYTAGIAICRSVEYSMGSMRQGVGNLYLLFPLRMAYDSVGCSNAAIGLWIQHVLQRIQDGKSGRWATARYVLGIKPASGRVAPVA